MEPLPGIHLVDLAVFLSEPKILILGDFHLGFEEYLTQKGVLIPKFHYTELRERIERILHTTHPQTIVVNGDLKHEFGTISNEEWRNTLKMIDFLSAQANLVLLRGNHDTILGPIARKREVTVQDYYLYQDIYICHGHRIPRDADFAKASTVIIGHEHPAIVIDDTVRRETYKCFLVGGWKKKKIVVMPSMHLLTEGTDILKEKLLSPFLDRVGEFRVYVVGDKVYDFGRVKNHY